ncbi:Mrr restriction system protein [compost metagenome]
MAGAPLPAARNPADVGVVVGQQAIKTFAMFGQFLLPFIFSIGALVSVLQRARRRDLLRQAGASPSKITDGMSWQEFELLVGEAFRLRGYAVEETASGPDGGVDLVLRKDGEKLLVQCKQWRAYKVGVSVIRELYGVMAAQGAAGGFVVTSGRFTGEAKAFAEGRNLTLIDGEQLVRWLPATCPLPAASATAQAAPANGRGASSASAQAPICPICQATMRRRTAKRGANVGRQFWGCSKFPVCRGVRA